MITSRIACLAAAAVLAPGCFGVYQPPESQAESSESSSTTGSVGSTDSNSTTGSESSTGPIGPQARDTDAEGVACDHFNVLVVFDLSPSMAGYVDMLEALFAVAGSGLETLSSIGSYHIGITTNKDIPSNMPAAPEGSTDSCTRPGSLIRTLNSGCLAEVGDEPFLDESSSIAAGMTCLIEGALTAGFLSDERRTLEAIDHAVDPSINADDGCNAGFYAEGEPLLIIVVTDAEDASPILPAQVAAQFVDGGSAEIAVWVLGGPSCSCEMSPDEGCDPEACQAEPPCRLRAFTNLVFTSDDDKDHASFTKLCDTTETIEADLNFALNEMVAKACQGASGASAE